MIHSPRVEKDLQTYTLTLLDEPPMSGLPGKWMK